MAGKSTKKVSGKKGEENTFRKTTHVTMNGAVQAIPVTVTTSRKEVRSWLQGLSAGRRTVGLNIHLSEKGKTAVVVLLSDYKCLVFQILLAGGLLPMELVEFFHDENNLFVCHGEKNEVLSRLNLKHVNAYDSRSLVMGLKGRRGAWESEAVRRTNCAFVTEPSRDLKWEGEELFEAQIMFATSKVALAFMLVKYVKFVE